jgi:arsenite-transporting ATPase
MRLILYLGKGGVGKTTVAAATAARCARQGYRTLIVSTDIAHSLADALNQPLSAEPVQVADWLWGQEVNVLYEVKTHWLELRDYFAALLRRRGVSNVIAEELALAPGMEEIASLLQIRKQYREQNFDVLIVDAAPTGETVRLLTIPETFQWYSGRLGEWGQQAWRLAKAVGLIPSNEEVDLLARLDQEVGDLRAILTDPKHSSCRVVLNPEKMVIRETQRAVMYLGLFGYPVDAAIVNRVLPAEYSDDPYLRRMQEHQRHYLKVIHETLRPLPLFEAPWYDHEPVGLQAIEQLAADLWEDTDPAQVFRHGPTQVIEEQGNEYLLRLPLPQLIDDEVEITKRGDELFISVGNFKRNLIIPNVLATREVGAGRVTADGMLEIHFLPTSSSD